jgi:hypothetical protein
MWRLTQPCLAGAAFALVPFISRSLAAANAKRASGPLTNLPSCLDSGEQHCVRPFQSAGDTDTLRAAPAQTYVGQPKRWDVLANTPAWNRVAWEAQQRSSQLPALGAESVAVCAMMGHEHPEDVRSWLTWHWCAPKRQECYSVHLLVTPHVTLPIGDDAELAGGLLA